ncbi:MULTISPECIES: TlpA disulfide reductase family protein [Caulobacter]|jgi:thiol-disulfide isomerase/thioredoxin|uniref:Thiol-disulfide isomerase-like thioredoxin n=1 Tax=Caulobacter vibrioides OR37 TaxID=1292034 RepID=R0E5H8_CAUVI|nr:MULTISPECIES: TlpA disulfide reductase family protein [Caulobacter]ENZ80823.1 thiol-disulfide isomerase-like thioredoxin [Caulobacter vibrioides OR37]MBQ1559427.1 TlpA family protein disulfide reductase [Caulobacter sp.]
MSEVQSEAAAKKRNPMRMALGGVILVGVAAVLYVIAAASFKPHGPADLREFKKASLEKLDVPAGPRAAPATPFTGLDGKTATLADFKGRVVVMNLWATWCAPCKAEMPTLAKLQAAYATQPLTVLPISVDRDSDLNLVTAEMAANPPLKTYRDPSYRMSFALDPKAGGFPTTVIYDKQGRERARMTGPADWASPEAKGLVEKLLAE